jgi:hypothetical protein
MVAEQIWRPKLQQFLIARNPRSASVALTLKELSWLLSTYKLRYAGGTLLCFMITIELSASFLPISARLFIGRVKSRAGIGKTIDTRTTTGSVKYESGVRSHSSVATYGTAEAPKLSPNLQHENKVSSCKHSMVS